MSKNSYDYSKFLKNRKENVVSHKNRDVWLYTRVSTKDQKDNFSLSYQKSEAYEFAKKHGYKITETFGNKNESASDDFTRKEFQEILNKVKNAKKKPYAILVYIMNRFSRTGGGAISIAHELIEEKGVNLIEIQSGIGTNDETGKQLFMKNCLKPESKIKSD